jgi:hypothetical protein
LLATDPETLTHVLGIVYRTISQGTGDAAEEARSVSPATRAR